MKNNNVVTLLLIILFSAVSFFGGLEYQKSKTPTFGNRAQGGQFQARTGANNRGGQIIGEILSQDDKSITVKLMDGSSKIVLLSSTTTISKATSGSKTDLTTGTRVGVFGQTNPDGSVTAQNIQLNPTMRTATPSATMSK